MKYTITMLMSLVVASVIAQDEVVQTGTPALLEAANGKKAKVFLQSLEGGNLTFQPFKSPKDMTVPASKIKSLQFFTKFDAETLKQSFNEADYSTVLATLEPVMQDFKQYMPIENNLQDAFCMMLDSYQGEGDFPNVRKAAATLGNSSNPDLVLKAKVGQALATIDAGDYAAAEKIGAELDSPAAALYLKALVERAQNNPRQAMQTVTLIISEHANDLEWLPKSELLSAYLYLDMTGSNSVITTNSALNTARQVKNMYGGSNISGDARKLWVSLGGEKLEAAEAEDEAAREVAVKAAKERREAEIKARKEAEAASKADPAAGTDTNSIMEMESE